MPSGRSLNWAVASDGPKTEIKGRTFKTERNSTLRLGRATGLLGAPLTGECLLNVFIIVFIVVEERQTALRRLWLCSYSTRSRKKAVGADVGRVNCIGPPLPRLVSTGVQVG